MLTDQFGRMQIRKHYNQSYNFQEYQFQVYRKLFLELEFFQIIIIQE